MEGHYKTSQLLPVAWILLSVLMLAADYFTGPVIQFPILYLFPIGLAAWFSGPWWGGSLAVALPLGRVVFSAAWDTPWRTMGHVAVNTSIRIAAFSLVVLLIHKVITTSRDVNSRRKTELKLLEQQRQLRILSADLAVAEETERRRIAAGLHDDINQMLIGSKLKLARLAHASGHEEIAKVSSDVENTIDKILSSSQSLIFDLISPVLQKLGLVAALDHLCECMEQQHGISFRFKAETNGNDLSNEMEIILFRAVREIVRNAVRHAEAQNVTVSYSCDRNVVMIRVEDDGVGFPRDFTVDGPTQAGGFGLFSVYEKMQYLGGTLRIEPVQPHGSRVELTVPLHAKGKGK